MSTITLPNIRVSSDLTVKVRLKDSEVAIDWSTLTKIKASIYSDAQRALAGRCDVSIDAEDPTLLVCQYAANKPQYVGVNRIVVSAKYMGETKTYDKPAFTFVRWTADQEGEEITIDDPDVDVEISVEDISSSILQEAVDAAFEAADRANDAAAAAEHMVDIHTGPEGKSAYEVAVEEGYVGTEEEWLASLVGPQGKQGIQGETGEAAGFGTVSVSLQEDGGQPSATVAASGTDTAKNFAFTFNNLKGEKGDKGDQGNTGSSVDYPYELVNNCTTDDATKGLAASQGVALQAEVSQLEAKEDEKFYGMVEQSLTIEQGAIASATGEDSAANNRIRTNGYIISTIIKVNITSGKYYVFGYDEDGYVGAATNGWKTISDTITKEGCSKYRIVFAKSNDANLGPSDFASLGVTVWAYDGTKKEVVLEDDIIDNVFTNDNKKPLSAAAGHRLFEKDEKGNSVFASALNNIVGAFDASKLVTWNEGKLWNCTTGKKDTLSNYKCSEPIDITGVTKVVVTGAATVDANHRPISVYVDGVYTNYRSGTVLAEDFSYNNSLVIVINAASATDVKVEFQSQSSKIDEAIEPINDKVTATVAFTGNLFLVSEDGYITSSGSGTGILSGAVLTPLVKVDEGDVIHFKGGWQQDDNFGLVWGYSDKELSEPVKLVNAVSNYDADIEVPSGVAYVRAWSLANKEPVFELQTSINTRLSRVEGMLPSLEKVGIDEDCTNLATDVPSTTSGSRKYIIINNKSAGVDGVVSQIKFSSIDSNLRFYVIVCELNLDGTKATIKSRYLITATGTGTHSKSVNIPIKQGQYLGVQGTGVEGDFLPSYGSTKTNGWYWNSNGSALVYRVEANVSFLQYYSVAFGYKITVDNYSKIPKTTTIVAERNNADYNSIREIMESITDASESNRYIIKIPKGRWFECDIVGKDYVSLVGEDMNDTIIYCDGTSDNLTPFDYSVAGNGNTALSGLPRADKHCINARADLDVEGLTIEATSCKYCVHIDNGGFKKARFKNCRFVVISDCLNPVGIGIRGSQNITFDGCQFIGTGLKGAYVHNWNNQLDVCHVSFQNCRFGSDYLTIGELGSEFSCFIELLNCYSDNQNPNINALVESNDGESYWIDPETGEPTSELTDVPYSIKLNAIGTSPFNLSQSNRENFLDYCIGKFN